MKKTLSLVLLFAVWPLGVVRAAGPFTVNTIADAHSVGFGLQGAPHSTGPTNNTGQYTLRSALEYASTVGGATTINLPAGSYNLSLGDLVAGTTTNTTISINGAGAASTTINQIQAGRMIFAVNYNLNSNVVFNVSGVTITGGSESTSDPDGFGGHGGAIMAGGSSTAPGNALNVTNVVFTNNACNAVSDAGANGGAIQMSGGGNLNVVNCTFTGNHSAQNSGLGFGGAINFDSGNNPGSVFINNSSFSNNLAPGAAGGALSLAGTNGNFTVTGCNFVNNSCVSNGTVGGAICVQSGNLTAFGNRFRGNYAATGGAVYISDNAGTMGNLTNNWWGGNGGPNSTSADKSFPTTGSAVPLNDGQIAFSPWLELNTTISENPMTLKDSATVTASFLANSLGQSVSAANLAPLIGLPVTWTSANGNLPSLQLTIQAGGTATATFTATNVGTGTVEAIVDGIAAGDPNATVSFFINPIPAPIFSSATNATFLVGSLGAFQVQASASPALSESGRLPVGVTFNAGAGLLSGTPVTGSGGVYPVIFTAANGGGTNSQNFTLTVDEFPSVTAPAGLVTNAANGVCSLPAISFAAGASGFPPPIVSYQLNGSTIFSPTTFPLGRNVVNCIATNSAGANSANFTVIVLPGAPPQLSAVRIGGKVFVSWPTNFGCYSLQTSYVVTLPTNQWQNFSGTIGFNGGNFIVTNVISGTNTFFRLAH